MSEAEAFEKIDAEIESFKKKEGLYKGIKILKKPHSDWLIFNWRQLTWKENEINFLMELYPNFDDQENITSWNFYVAAWYDQNGKRFYLNKKFAGESTIEFIAKHFQQLLEQGFEYLSTIKKAEIPFAVELI